MRRHHVVVLTYGEPPTPSFRRQFDYSWRILRNLTRRVAPIPTLALPAIALWRAGLRVRLWRSEGYGSPIETITRAQCDRLAEALAEIAADRRYVVHLAYEFRPPMLGNVLAGLPADEPVSVLPMYLADSEFTHQIARDTLGSGSDLRTVVPALDPDTLAGMSARHIEDELARRRFDVGPDWALVLAAHGTLLAPPRPMETGREATERVARGIADRLAHRFGRVRRAWLNHKRGGAWTEPPADRALAGLAAAGFRRIVYFPYGFLADNAESQLEGRVLLRNAGFEEVVHLPCLNESPELAQALARAVAGVAQDELRLAESR